MAQDLDDTEKLVQFSCNGCLGEVFLRHPFLPRFCAHCGAELIFNGNRIPE